MKGENRTRPKILQITALEFNGVLVVIVDDGMHTTLLPCCYPATQFWRLKCDLG